MTQAIPKKMPLSELSRHVGEEMGVSSWTTLDQERINQFAHCTGDHQWIHVDAERAARESPFGGTIAHGYLTVSLIAPTAFELLVSRVEPKSVVNYGLEKVRFYAPVRSGKRVRKTIFTPFAQATVRVYEAQIRPAFPNATSSRIRTVLLVSRPATVSKCATMVSPRIQSRVSA